jgi:DNA gyrase subunit A
MATNMPPHKLGEVVDAVVQLIDKPEANADDLMKHVKGPDFPTGAIVVGRSGMSRCVRTGRGRIVMRAPAHIEELRGGKNAIIVTELPYGVKKGGDGGVISKIADLVREKVITEISGPPGLLDKLGMRIQIELKREAVPQVALNKLFKHTALQTTFGYNAVALVDGVPRTLSLLEFVRPLPRLPARGRHCGGRSSSCARHSPERARTRGLPHRARQPRRGHPADPCTPTTRTRLGRGLMERFG